MQKTLAANIDESAISQHTPVDNAPGNLRNTLVLSGRGFRRAGDRLGLRPWVLEAELEGEMGDALPSARRA